MPRTRHCMQNTLLEKSLTAEFTRMLRVDAWREDPYKKDVEAKLKDILGLSWVSTVQSGSAALRLSLLACGLKPGDEVIIPPTPNTVTVRGNVANEGLIKYNPGKRVNYYLDRAGGEGEMSQSVYLTQASGATYRINRQWYWFNQNPVVDDGAIIRVTREPEREPEERVNFAEVMRDVTTVLTTTLTILVLADRAGI